MSKTVEELGKKKSLMEKELNRLLEINAEILGMHETSMLCSEMKNTIQEYRNLIQELQDLIDGY